MFPVWRVGRWLVHTGGFGVVRKREEHLLIILGHATLWLGNRKGQLQRRWGSGCEGSTRFSGMVNAWQDMCEVHTSIGITADVDADTDCPIYVGGL